MGNDDDIRNGKNGCIEIDSSEFAAYEAENDYDYFHKVIFS